MLSRCIRFQPTRILSSQTTVPARFYTAKSTSKNSVVINALKLYLEQEENAPERNVYKVRAFKNAIEAVEGLDRKLVDGDDARKVKGIGLGISRRIGALLSGEEEIPVPTIRKRAGGKRAFTEADRARSKAIQMLQTIPCIGTSKATSLVDGGYSTIAKLQAPGKHRDALSPPMKVGIDHFQFLNKPISRTQTEDLLDFCRTFLRINGEISIAGSYRRGVEDIHEIEILVSTDDGTIEPQPPAKPFETIPLGKKAGRTIVPYLKGYTSIKDLNSTPLLTHVIAPLQSLGLVSDATHIGATKWRGWLRIPNRNEDHSWENRKSRLENVAAKKGSLVRVDFNCTPTVSKAAGMLALTGDLEFYLDIQRKATTLGMQLNEWGLWKWEPTKLDSKEGTWSFVHTDEEQDVFTEVGLEYIEPERRHFSNMN